MEGKIRACAYVAGAREEVCPWPISDFLAQLFVNVRVFDRRPDATAKADAGRRPPGVRKKSSTRGGNFPPSSTPRGEAVSAVQEETRISWSSTVAPPSTAMQLLEQQHAAGGCHVEYEAEDEKV